MTRRWFCVLAAAVSLWGAGCGDDDKAAKKSSGEAEMNTSSEGLDRVIEEAHAALRTIVNGNSEGYNLLFSERDDVSLGNPFGPFVHGRQKIVETVANAATRYRDGEIVGFDLIAKYVTDDLACVVEVERFRAKVGGGADLVTLALRTTQLFRPEDGAWKLVHRHSDPITTPQATESIIPK
jgi:ketosteroid isomerase-like protein